MLKAGDDIKSVIILLLDLLLLYFKYYYIIIIVNRFGVRDSVLYWFRSYLQFFLLIALNRH